MLVELRDHLPLSVLAVAVGLVVAGVICVFIDANLKQEVIEPADTVHADVDTHSHQHASTEWLFHLFHPAHALFSAAATAAMFARYERKLLKAGIVGLLGAVVVCGISDIAMPHLSLLILGYQAPLHLCVVQHPSVVIPFALSGVAVGLLASLRVSRSTLFSHALHVFASTMASIFYLVGAIGLVAWIDRIGFIVLFVLAAVVIPCCLSDIVFPLAMSQRNRSAVCNGDVG